MALGPAWTCPRNLAPTGNGFPDGPAYSESLYTIRHASLKNIIDSLIPSNGRPNSKNKLLGGNELTFLRNMNMSWEHLYCVHWTLSVSEWRVSSFRLFAEGTSTAGRNAMPFSHWPTGLPNIKPHQDVRGLTEKVL